jgi:hypothetical protein
MGGKAKHSRPSLWERLTRRRPRLALRPPAPFDRVDLRTGITHLLTPMPPPRVVCGEGATSPCAGRR